MHIMDRETKKIYNIRNYNGMPKEVDCMADIIANDGNVGITIDTETGHKMADMSIIQQWLDWTKDMRIAYICEEELIELMDSDSDEASIKSLVDAAVCGDLLGEPQRRITALNNWIHYNILGEKYTKAQILHNWGKIKNDERGDQK